jgi:methyl-accepting chemotaxis protein
MSLKISTRLWLPTAAIAGVLVVMATVQVTRTSGLIALADNTARAQESKLQDASAWQALTASNVTRVVASVISSDPAVESTFKPEIDATTAKISEIQKRIESDATQADEKAALAKINDSRKAYIDARTAARKLKADGDLEGAKAALASKVQPAVAAYLGSQQAYVKLQQEYSESVRAQAAKERMRTVWLSIGIMGLVVLAMAGGTVLLVRSICRPMNELSRAAHRIADGELDVEVDTSRDDEIGEVQQSLAAMRNAFRGIVGQVRTAAESIQVASAEVASGNTDLSHRTEQAAASLQQTASSMEQLTGNVRQSADAASQANQLASSASAVAQRGGQVVSQVVSTMDEINHSSKRIADIIGTIDGIAFQTNILALNAAVEAARAGEQGRGFAVVAGEVRSLAQRSADAAREIKGLITASVERVDTGARLVQDAGATMNEIVASVQRVTDIIGEITAAASEQSSGIAQVNGAVSTLDQMTQQNAALVEESAAAAESLRDQAIKLSESMQVFRLTGGAAGRSQPSPIASSPAPAKASAAPARASTPPRAAPAPRPAAVASHAIAQAQETSRPVSPPSNDDWESF